jgi:regulator of replication initiation timing
MPDQNDKKEQLKSAREESERLRAENARLRAMLGILDSAAERERNGAPEIGAVDTFSGSANQVWTPEKKITLFRSLFRVKMGD